jgi:LysW-gamma-L-lysine carboxypeptidase
VAGGAAGGQSVILLGHMDTVPGAIPVERRDGALFGRGAVDAKGPLAAAVVAAGRAAGSARSRIVVIGAVGEEGPSPGARHLAGQPAPDYLVIAEPSAWDAVVLGYKGSQRFCVELSQPCSHSSGPGPTAPQRAVTFWSELVAWCAEQSPPNAHSDFDRLTPTLLGMRSASDGLRESATMEIGLRLPPGVAVEDLPRRVAALSPDGAFRFAAGEPAVRAPRNSRLAARFLSSIRQEGGRPRFKVKTATSDMNVVGPSWGCPMVAYGPGDSHLDHTPQEHLCIDEYLRAIRVLTRVLTEL